MRFWPGNIRELQNVIERAVILSPGTSLQVPLGDLQPPATPTPAPTADAVTLADAEREHILGALRETGWVVGGPKGAGPPGDEAFNVVLEDEEARHLSARVVRARWRLRARLRAIVDTPPPSYRPSRPVRLASRFRDSLSEVN